MTSVSVDRELLEDLVDSKLQAITDRINGILAKWKYTSSDRFLAHAADGTLEEAEPDAISLTNLLDRREKLHQLKISWGLSS